MTSTRRLALAYVALATSISAADLQMFEAVEPHMGTLVRIQLYTAGEAQATAAFRASFDRIAELDRTLSDYRAESELNQITLTAIRRPVKISADLFAVLAASQKLTTETRGAFYVTLGPVIRIWREARRTSRLPDDAGLREAAARTGYRKLHLDAEARTVMFDQAEMQLDVGGIAKGYAADAAREVLAKLGIRSALVAASGDLAIGDPPPGRRGWKIGTADRVLELSNTAVSTSGDIEQHLDSDGIRYSHIIDPSTNKGVRSPRTMTIVTARGVDADGLATAASILGPDFLSRYPGVRVYVTDLSRAPVQSRPSADPLPPAR